MKIVVIGGTGLIGSRLVKKLGDHGHEAIAAAPNTGVNSITGQGLADALKGASAVVDVTNSPSWEDAAVLKFFETSTRNLSPMERPRLSDITLRCRSSGRNVCSKAGTSAQSSLRRT